MNENNKQKLTNFTIEVIDYFLSIPESIAHSFDRKEFYRIIRGCPTDNILTYSKIAQIIGDFKKRGYIEVQKSGQGEVIVFTNKAKLAVVDKTIKKNQNDGKFCFVSFDIPEKNRIGRDQFRRAIKRMGFVQIQKSLWACDKNVGEFVDIATIEYEVDEFVVYLVTEITNIDVYLKGLFDNNING